MKGFGRSVLAGVILVVVWFVPDYLFFGMRTASDYWVIMCAATGGAWTMDGWRDRGL